MNSSLTALALEMDPSPLVATARADSDQWAKWAFFGQALDRNVMCGQADQKTKSSDEDICHRRSNLAGGK